MPTGIRILFGTKDAATRHGVDRSNWSSSRTTTPPGCAGHDGPHTTLSFSGVDFRWISGGAQYTGQIDESTVQAGDYFTRPASRRPT